MISEELASPNVISKIQNNRKFKYPTLAIESSHKVLELETLKTFDTVSAHDKKIIVVLLSTNKVDKTQTIKFGSLHFSLKILWLLTSFKHSVSAD